MKSLTVVVIASLVPTLTAAQQHSTRHAQIVNALSAAPQSVAQLATVMTMSGDVLREGGTAWVCFPDDPSVPNNSPMCLDEVWREVVDAWVNRRQPEFEGIGIGYMLQGDLPVSNVDPFATGPTPDNQWLPQGVPHLMIVVSDPALLDALTTDPSHGGPWVMWKGTPYAHLMIPMDTPKP